VRIGRLDRAASETVTAKQESREEREGCEGAGHLDFYLRSLRGLRATHFAGSVIRLAGGLITRPIAANLTLFTQQQFNDVTI
jgi:hypothetical protein